MRPHRGRTARGRSAGTIPRSIRPDAPIPGPGGNAAARFPHRNASAPGPGGHAAAGTDRYLSPAIGPDRNLTASTRAGDGYFPSGDTASTLCHRASYLALAADDCQRWPPRIVSHWGNLAGHWRPALTQRRFIPLLPKATWPRDHGANGF